MSEPTLADVLAKLDELQRAVEVLHGLVSGPSATPQEAPASGRAPAPDGVAASARAAVEPVRPPAATSPQPAPPGSAASAVADAPVEDGGDEGAEGEPPSPRPSDRVEDVLRLLFSAALREPEEEAWAYLAALTHSRDIENPRALDYLKAFNWRKLRRSLDRYLVNRDPSSFQVVRTDPAEIGDADYIKVFLHQQGGMPGPVHLSRDPKKGGAWLVAQISL